MANRKIKCPECGTIIDIDGETYRDIVAQIREAELSAEIDRMKADYESKLAGAVEEQHLKDQIVSDKSISEKDAEITRLQAEIKTAEERKELAVEKAVKEKEREVTEANNALVAVRAQITADQAKHEQEILSVKETCAATLRAKDEEVQFYKDFKAKQSTKAVGESLEHFCENEFNKYRATGFQNAYFEKDNEVSKTTGSKGDFIFRENDDSGLEIISIMFEMKNDMESTQVRHRNEDFLKELDKDRKEKGCEYAVLVSMLEPDSELYNTGIVDVSHRYPKMYVIRPTFLIPMITLLRNAALKSMDLKHELLKVREEHIDITKFEDHMEEFKQKFGRDCRLASEKFDEAIEGIDATIAKLQKIREALTSSENHVRLANNKAQQLTIKQLTKDNPVMEAKFDEIRREKDPSPDKKK